MKKLFSEIPYIEGNGIILRKITQDDADSLRELTESEAVYRYLPTFLFEKKYDSIEYVIDHLPRIDNPGDIRQSRRKRRRRASVLRNRRDVRVP